MDHNAIVDEILRRVAEKISEAEGGSADCGESVSYTHLTLPTICSV